MEPPPGSNIVIRLEVYIPTTPGQGAPIVSATTTAGPAPAPAMEPAAPCCPAPQQIAVAMQQENAVLAPSGITCPFDTARVKVAYGATTGVICAAGRASTSYPYGKPNVKVKIYQDVLATVPEEFPDPDAVNLGRTDDSGNWFVEELGTAACGPPGYGHDNKLVVWLEYDGESKPRLVTCIFTGICAATTDECDRRFSVQESLTFGAPTLIVPVWQTTVSGFAGGKLSRFSRAWSLVLNTAQPYLWTCADPAADSRVELFLTRPCNSTWKLVFCSDDYRIEYSLPADQWCCDGANIFTSVQTFGLPLHAAVPASVVLLPSCDERPPFDEPAEEPPRKSARGRSRRRLK